MKDHFSTDWGVASVVSGISLVLLDMFLKYLLDRFTRVRGLESSELLLARLVILHENVYVKEYGPLPDSYGVPLPFSVAKYRPPGIEAREFGKSVWRFSPLVWLQAVIRTRRPGGILTPIMLYI